MENAIIHNRDIIMFGLQPWDTAIGSNFKNMAVEITKHNRVLYVNRPLDRITAWKQPSTDITKRRKESIKKGTGIIEQIQHNLWILDPAVLLESINWLPEGFFYNYLNKQNCKKLAMQISQASSSLQFNDPILIIDNDFFNGLYLKEYLKVNCMVYYIRDYLLSQPYFVKHGKRSEPELISKADVVTANSTYLADYAKKYNTNSFYIGQGCEVENFVGVPYVFPADVFTIKKPVIGYCGALISTRLDINLLVAIAEQKPEWNFVLVGPEDEAFKNSRLHSLKNVYFLGSKKADELPGYVHYFDVCLNPQVVNQMTIGNYPRKVDEYLAAGKPVVATATEAMKEFEGYTFLCKNQEEYIRAIENALQETGDKDKAANRVSLAKSHTWENSIAGLYKAINQLN